MIERTTAVSTRPPLEKGRPWRNWSRSVNSHPTFVSRVSSVDQVVQTVLFAREQGLTVRPVGAGHSFTAIAATDGIQLDLAGLDGVIQVEGNFVTLAAGTHLHQLPALLEPYGLALPNMGDIDRQTIAGATSTGTHGTGAAFTGLAGQIRAATLVTATGDLLHVNARENPELLPAVALGLGALGVLVTITIECVPAFLLHAHERPEPLDDVLDTWMQRIGEADHFEFYVWPHADVALTKTNTRLPADAERRPLGALREAVEDRFVDNEVFRGILAFGRAFPGTIPAINRLATRLTGNREFTDSSYDVFTSPRTVRFREMEYAIDVEAIPEAVREVRRVIETHGWHIEFPIEVRAAARDDLWLSTASGRESGYIAVHRWFRVDQTEYFREVEAVLKHFGGRPHWGKMHTRTAEDLAPAYPHFADFVAVRDALDPDRVFANDYLTRVLGA